MRTPKRGLVSLACEGGLVTEKELLTHVRKIAKDLGVLTYHTHDSRRSEPGFPDIVALTKNGVLWRELKTAKGRLSPEQRVWLDTLTRAGQDAGVWRPADLMDGTITRELAGLR